MSLLQQKRKEWSYVSESEQLVICFWKKLRNLSKKIIQTFTNSKFLLYSTMANLKFISCSTKKKLMVAAMVICFTGFGWQCYDQVFKFFKVIFITFLVNVKADKKDVE